MGLVREGLNPDKRQAPHHLRWPPGGKVLHMDLLLEEEADAGFMDGLPLEEEAKQVMSDQEMEDVQLGLQNLLVTEGKSRKLGSTMSDMVKLRFGPEILLSTVLDKIVLDQGNKSLLGHRSKRDKRKLLDRCGTSDLFKCRSCKKSFLGCFIDIHEAGCVKSHQNKPCKSCARPVSGKNLSRHMFQGSCKGVSKFSKNIRRG